MHPGLVTAVFRGLLLQVVEGVNMDVSPITGAQPPLIKLRGTRLGFFGVKLVMCSKAPIWK
jgi:hypothetical protein